MLDTLASSGVAATGESLRAAPAHVLAGLLFSLWTQGRAWQGAFDEYRHLTVQNFAMYWHFVDTVWVFVLATLYLSPHL